MTTYFPEVRRWLLPPAALRLSLEEMAIDGREGNEGIALWLGRREDGLATVSHVIRLRGPLVEKAPDLLTVDSLLFADVTILAADLGLQLVGQVHSHGPWSGVAFSRTDHTYGLRVPFYLSAVAPDYAQRPDTRPEEYGFHVYRPGVGYQLLDPADVRDQILTSEEHPVNLLTVGEDDG